jgi:hypothetical protein
MSVDLVIGGRSLGNQVVGEVFVFVDDDKDFFTGGFRSVKGLMTARTALFITKKYFFPDSTKKIHYYDIIYKFLLYLCRRIIHF